MYERQNMNMSAVEIKFASDYVEGLRSRGELSIYDLLIIYADYMALSNEICSVHDRIADVTTRYPLDAIDIAKALAKIRGIVLKDYGVDIDSLTYKADLKDSFTKLNEPRFVEFKPHERGHIILPNPSFRGDLVAIDKTIIAMDEEGNLKLESNEEPTEKEQKILDLLQKALAKKATLSENWKTFKKLYKEKKLEGFLFVQPLEFPAKTKLAEKPGETMVHMVEAQQGVELSPDDKTKLLSYILARQSTEGGYLGTKPYGETLRNASKEGEDFKTTLPIPPIGRNATGDEISNSRTQIKGEFTELIINQGKENVRLLVQVK